MTCCRPSARCCRRRWPPAAACADRIAAVHRAFGSPPPAHPEPELRPDGLRLGAWRRHSASGMTSAGQFQHPLVARLLEIAAACHANGKVPSHLRGHRVQRYGRHAGRRRSRRAEFGYTRMWSIHPAQIRPIWPPSRPGMPRSPRAAIIIAAPSTPTGPHQKKACCTTAPVTAISGSCWSVRIQTGRALPQQAQAWFANPDSAPT